MKKTPASLKKENVDAVMNLFFTTNENTAPAISKKTGLSESVVNIIIDNHLNIKYGK